MSRYRARASVQPGPAIVVVAALPLLGTPGEFERLGLVPVIVGIRVAARNRVATAQPA